MYSSVIKDTSVLIEGKILDDSGDVMDYSQSDNGPKSLKIFSRNGLKTSLWVNFYYFF